MTTEREALVAKWRADAAFYRAGGEPDKSVAYDRCADELAALTRQEAKQECPKCGGTGGERWHEADGSENGARCDACDGFGTQQEAQGAVALLRAAREGRDALERLRRGYGADVSEACYPALNSLRTALDAIDAAQEADREAGSA